MNYLPKVVSVENMRQSDRRTIEQSVTSAELMHRAAQGIFNAVQFVGKVAIVCGSGNNGGDGYALACILAENGITPTIFRVSEKFSKDGLYYYQTAMSLGCEEGTLSVPSPLLGFDIVVDCILGTGFSGELRGEVKKAVEEILAITMRYCLLVGVIFTVACVLCPELLMHMCTLDSIDSHLTQLLGDTPERQTMLDGYARLAERLGTEVCTATAARLITQSINN